jgi:predicted nucleotide-binding protein
MVERTEMIERAQMYIERLAQLNSPDDMQFEVWQSRVFDFLKLAFGVQSWQYERFVGVKWKAVIRVTVAGTDYSSLQVSIFRKGKADAKILLEECILDFKTTYVESAIFHGKDAARRVFITHGRNPEWMEVQRYIESTIKIPTVELSQAVSLGRTIIEKLEQESDNCGYAVIVMSGDDTGEDGSIRVRENVMHEVGWFQAKYGRGRVCLLHEDGVSIPSNISGLAYIPYPKGRIKAAFADFRDEIEAVYGKTASE